MDISEDQDADLIQLVKEISQKIKQKYKEKKIIEVKRHRIGFSKPSNRNSGQK